MFFLFQVLPGNPVISKLGVENAGNEALRQNLIEKYNINAPIGQRYFNWIGDAFSLDFGNSFSYEGYSVLELILPRFGVTLKLTVLTLLFSTFFGLLLAIFMSVNQKSRVTTFLEYFIIIGISIPSFCVGILLITIFALSLGLVSISSGGLFLPVLSLAIPSTSLITRYLYLNLMGELEKDYAMYAKAKGLRDLQIVLRHSLKNSMVPFFGVFLTIFLSIITGSVLIENVYTLNGIGRFMVSGIKSFDYPLVSGIVFCYCILILTISWLVDILNFIIDKRIQV